MVKKDHANIGLCNNSYSTAIAYIIQAYSSDRNCTQINIYIYIYNIYIYIYIYIYSLDTTSSTDTKVAPAT